jgi:hypothetical protein
MATMQASEVDRSAARGRPVVPAQSPATPAQATPAQAIQAQPAPAPGELVRAAVAALPRAGLTVLTDFVHPGDRFAAVDHVVVGAGGVFVVAAAPGWLRLTDDGLGGDAECPARLAAATQAAVAVAELLPRLDPGLVTPVLCLAREDDVDGCVHDVLVCTAGNLGRLLAGWPALVDPATAGLLGRRLAIQQLPRRTAAALPRGRRSRGLRALLGRG